MAKWDYKIHRRRMDEFVRLGIRKDPEVGEWFYDEHQDRAEQLTAFTRLNNFEQEILWWKYGREKPEPLDYYDAGFYDALELYPPQKFVETQTLGYGYPVRNSNEHWIYLGGYLEGLQTVAYNRTQEKN